MIKKFVVNNSLNLISDLNKYDKTQLEEIKYGIESIYLAISKVVIIMGIAAIFGLFKEAILYLLLFNVLRVTAFGFHASKSIWCWIISSIAFIIFPYICKNYVFSEYIYYIFSIIFLLLIAIYAPADTVKRPLINSKKRKIYKIISIFSSCIFIVIILTNNNYLLKNMLLFALAFESILILPITYKIFKLPYRNYQNYKN